MSQKADTWSLTEPVEKRARVRWIEYLDDGHVIFHDGQRLTIESLGVDAGAHLLDPLGVTEQVDANAHLSAFYEPFDNAPPHPMFIADAELSPDRGMLALASPREVIVYAVRRPR